jgi:FAD/FMN-containing dehydrogenase
MIVPLTMIVRPNAVAELQEALIQANASRQRISGFDLSALNRLIEHESQDMTATVEAGMTLGNFQNRLATHKQWLPIDPPEPDQLTIGNLLSTNASGPRRFGHGTIRDSLLGLAIVLPTGEIIRPGGKVVKNVAGYDLGKLFIGARDSLGPIIQATFKLKPLPEAERFVQATFQHLEEAGRLIESIVSSPLDPVVFDLHKVSNEVRPQKMGFTVVLGFAGAFEDVEYQMAIARDLGASEPSNLDYDRVFWSRNVPDPPRRRSVLPSEVVNTIHQLGLTSFVARAGNGLIHYRGGSAPAEINKHLSLDLIRGVKNTYDPNHILPDIPL